MTYHALTKEDYHKLIFDTPLNIGLKSFFAPISTANDYDILVQYILDARAELINLAQSIRSKAVAYPISCTPLQFIVDSNSSSGGKFLRWRNQSNTKNGKPAWESLIKDKHVPADIKEALIALEKDRIAFNAQMSVLNFMLRQLRDCKQKMLDVEMAKK